MPYAFRPLSHNSLGILTERKKKTADFDMDFQREFQQSVRIYKNNILLYKVGIILKRAQPFLWM